MSELEQKLLAYQKGKRLFGKGALSAMLHATRLAIEKGLPIDVSRLVTKKQGQAKGLGKPRVQSILKDHGITRVLAEECGRTSRGSLGNIQEYAAFLDELERQGLADLPSIERWWVERVLDFFSSQPFRLRYDASKSLRAIVRDLLDQAVKRQQENPGTSYAGTVLQHLVGAKLELALPRKAVRHHGASVADAAGERAGDFEIDDVVVHVTVAAGEALLRKCLENLESGRRPIIVTSREGFEGALYLARKQGLEGRVEVLEAEQFIATNLYEKSLFKVRNLKVSVLNLTKKYNEIVTACETDTSLTIDLD